LEHTIAISSSSGLTNKANNNTVSSTSKQSQAAVPGGGRCIVAQLSLPEWSFFAETKGM
jgi:hypothetical protein